MTGLKSIVYISSIYVHAHLHLLHGLHNLEIKTETSKMVFIGPRKETPSHGRYCTGPCNENAKQVETEGNQWQTSAKRNKRH